MPREATPGARGIHVNVYQRDDANVRTYNSAGLVARPHEEAQKATCTRPALSPAAHPPTGPHSESHLGPSPVCIRHGVFWVYPSPPLPSLSLK